MSCKLNASQRSELLSLKDASGGRLTASAVVEAARDEESALHRFIGWHRPDDELAGAYRLDRARLAIASLQLKENEALAAELGKVKDRKERGKLAEKLEQMKKLNSRRMISYQEDQQSGGGYRDVVEELAAGREEALIRQLLLELSKWVANRALIVPAFHAHMLGVIEAARSKFVAEAAYSEAGH